MESNAHPVDDEGALPVASIPGGVAAVAGRSLGVSTLRLFDANTALAMPQLSLRIPELRLTPSITQSAVTSILGRGFTLPDTWLGAHAAKVLDSALSPHTERLRELAESIREGYRRLFPPNLAGIEDLDLDRVESLADEGVPLWGVPSGPVARRLLAVETLQSRRRVIGDNWRAILDDCVGVATASGGQRFSSESALVTQAAEALRAGYTAAGQSLAANTLDSLLWATFTSDARQRLTNHKSRQIDHFERLKLSAAMVFRPIWFAYRPQHTPAERAVSSSFARHAVTHRIGGRQINRRNAVQAVMLAVSLIHFLGTRQ